MVPQLFGYWNNPAAWSLSAEAFFYLTFPFWLRAFIGLDRRGLLLALAMTYVLSVLSGFVYAVFEPRPTHGLRIFYAMPIFRLPEFAFGILLYLLVKEVRTVLNLAMAAAGLLLTTVLYLTAVGGLLPIYVLHNWIVVPTIGLCMVAMARGYGWAGRVLSSPLFVWGEE